ALKNILPNVKRTTLTLVAGLIGTILAALNIIDYFQAFLSLLSMTVASIAGVIWIDYYIVQKMKLGIRRGVNWQAISAWAVGVIVAYFSSQLSLGITPINTIITSALLYYILSKLNNNLK